ncbi:MAG TPA: molybdopterin-guanine dinucleotide biosynthesis protein B, partial [Gammaproteobacteria bacterium]|nr:molybdopterin-guanine dinucleotide biosynthesis protein B [Gammaproteobacteria bacterium]
MKTFRYRGIPVVGFAAFSGTGKTTLMRKLIPCLAARGKRTAIVKHAHHDFDIDHPGKDSYELRRAGANQVLVGSGERWAMVAEKRSGKEPLLTNFLEHLVISDTDLTLVEGFRHLTFPKIEVHRKSLNRGLFYENDDFIIAIVTDDVDTHKKELPTIDLERVEELAD